MGEVGLANHASRRATHSCSQATLQGYVFVILTSNGKGGYAHAER